MLANEVPIPELVLWRAVKMGSYKDTGSEVHLPPAAVVSWDAMQQDERYVRMGEVSCSDMPLYREKVPYVVVVGGPNVSASGCVEGQSRLYDQVVSPSVLLGSSGADYRVNNEYYITKQVIPVLNRVGAVRELEGSCWRCFT